jgi:hypothetical protein
MIPWHMGVSTHRHWGLNEEIRVRRDVQNRASSRNHLYQMRQRRDRDARIREFGCILSSGAKLHQK